MDDKIYIIRFMRKVRKTGYKGCWQWVGAKTEQGYGTIRKQNKTMAAHRYSYMHYIGPIPDKYVIDHLCRNRACVRPDHLEAITIGENVLRGTGHSARNKKKTHCAKGHPYVDDAVRYDNPNGSRQCRICRNESLKKTRVKGGDRKLPARPLATHCSKGHKYDWVYWRKDGYPQQVCKQCQVLKSQAWRDRKKVEA